MYPLEWKNRLEEASKQSCLLVCTTRDGSDWEVVDREQERLLEELGAEATVFTSEVGGPGEQEGKDLSMGQATDLARMLGLSDQVFYGRFDGTPGSLLLDLKDMRRRYRELRSSSRGGVSMSRLLDSAKLLYEAQQPTLRKEVLRAVAEEIRGTGRVSHEIWDELVRRTQEEGFASFDDAGNLLTYRPYLEECVSYKPSENEIACLQPILSRERDLYGLFYLGVFWTDQNDHSSALDCYEEVVELDPTDFTALMNKGSALGDLRKYDKAIEAFDAALEIDSNNADAFYNKGTALHNLGEHRKAVKAYDAALQRSPGHAKALYNKIVALLKQQKWEEAIEHLCEGWRSREQLSDGGELLLQIFHSRGKDPRECE